MEIIQKSELIHVVSPNPYIFDGKICEDFEQHWGFLDIRGKVVMDFGADVGSTPSFFLGKEAKRVIAISGKEDFDGLVNNIKKFGWGNKVVALNRWITDLNMVSNLVIAYKPDIIKFDLDPMENGQVLNECHLINCSDNVLNLVREYAIEWHNTTKMRDAIISRFSGLGYKTELKFVNGIVVWAKKQI